MLKKRKLRVLFSSNAPWSTSGYGTQMHDLLPLIHKAGFPTGIVCFYGLEGGKIILDGITCYPKINDQWGGDAVTVFQNDFQADVVFTLQDIWVLNPQHLAQFKRWIPIVPIDHEPVPRPVFDRLKAAYRVVTYSQFGYDELKRQGMHSTYIQHTVDTKILTPRDKSEIRKRLSIPEDVFLFGMVAANKDNPPRKSFHAVLEAFKAFKEKHPKSALYVHTVTDQPSGFPIREYAKFLGIADSLYEISPLDMMFNVNRDGMAQIYSAMDCLLMPSTNEGFGVPAVEAQSCGVPVIVNNFTAMPELVAPGTGAVCEVDHKRFTPLLSYVAEPSVSSLLEKMEEVYAGDLKEQGKICRDFVTENYDVHKIFTEKWLPFLQKLEKEVLAEA